MSDQRESVEVQDTLRIERQSGGLCDSFVYEFPSGWDMERVREFLEVDHEFCLAWGGERSAEVVVRLIRVERRPKTDITDVSTPIEHVYRLPEGQQQVEELCSLLESAGFPRIDNRQDHLPQ
ncbi:MAG: hypothetical protein OXG35_26595 [Acidobacteria bacterium]|nr:hypothetical protein [Acidobacteriota bacterium]